MASAHSSGLHLWPGPGFGEMGWVESIENWLTLPFLEATTQGLKGEVG